LRLRELALSIPDTLTPAICQQLIDALPVLRDLSCLNLGASGPSSAHPQLSAPLSLDPLLQLPHLT
jgi:hypothetical protein